MQISSIKEAQIEPVHWIHVKKPMAYADLASDSYSVQNNSGKVSVLLSSKQKLTATDGPNLCATVPGYTGDADTHDRLIRKALERGIGVICATPRWSGRTSQIVQNFEDLYQTLKGGPVSIQGLHFIRANSFGSFLALGWMKSLGSQLKKVAFVTPCSAKQLPYAGDMIQRLVIDDLESVPSIHQDLISVRIVSIKKDAIVPATDPLFYSLSENTESLEADSEDHFTAGDLNVSSEDIVDWFAEGL